jgi:hypothetical protein
MKTEVWRIAGLVGLALAAPAVAQPPPTCTNCGPEIIQQLRTVVNELQLLRREVADRPSAIDLHNVDVTAISGVATEQGLANHF